MKTKKLQLGKVTVTNLEKLELNKVRGGTVSIFSYHYENTCIHLLCVKEITYGCNTTIN